MTDRPPTQPDLHSAAESASLPHGYALVAPELVLRELRHARRACQHAHGLRPHPLAPVADHLRTRLLVPELGADAVGDDHVSFLQRFALFVPSKDAVLVC